MEASRKVRKNPKTGPPMGASSWANLVDEIIAVGKRPIVSMPYLIVAVESSHTGSASDGPLLWCLAVMSTERFHFKPYNPVYCPSAAKSVDCSYVQPVTLVEVDKTIGRIDDCEVEHLVQELRAFHDHRQSINIVSLLMFIRSTVLPLLTAEFSTQDYQSSALKLANDRIEQMNEIFDFFVGVVELNPRRALQELDQRNLPLPPAKSNLKHLRNIYSGRTSSFVASQLAEELILYCRSKWLRGEKQAEVELATLRLIELFELTRESHSELSTMLLRLPAPIRKEICFFESDRKN
jgi:hypothetical protein